MTSNTNSLHIFIRTATLEKTLNIVAATEHCNQTLPNANAIVDIWKSVWYLLATPLLNAFPIST